jgi:YrbI family 3-deoxy-D-manno-octulosonate 8-phosphate phosphatase
MKDRAKKIKWLFTDVDGVLTDCGVYYSENGEELKRFSLRDGMGAERLRKFTNIQIAIMTGENSGPVSRRAEKLKIEKVFLGVKDKLSVMKQFLLENNLTFDEIAYIGDDINDLEVIQHAGVTACPADAVNQIKANVDYIAENNGGYGAFRDFCEYIILELSKD